MKLKKKKIQLRFIDRIRFIESGSDSLTNNLVKDTRKLNALKIILTKKTSYS